MADRAPLSLDQIRQQLDSWLETGFSGLQTDEPARVIATLGYARQDRLLTWTRRMASINLQLAHQFLLHAVATSDSLDREILEAWALQTMDSYDQFGLHRALEVVHGVDEFVRRRIEQRSAATFEQHVAVLVHFVHGLSGRALQLQQGQSPYTDTATIFLPPVIARLPTAQDNFQIYKCLVACLWAQTRFGTFAVDLQAPLGECDQPEQLLGLFQAFESVRLEFRLQQQLPGLYRSLQQLHERLGDQADDEWRALSDELRAPDARAHDSLRLAQRYLGRIENPPRSFLHGELYPEQADAVIRRRMQTEKARFRQLLHQAVEAGSRHSPAECAQYTLDKQITYNEARNGVERMQLSLDGQPVPLPDAVMELANSIVQDVGYLPGEYLTPAGPGEYDWSGPTVSSQAKEEPDAGTDDPETVCLYPEWDYRRQHYRRHWCTVRESSIAPVYDDFYAATLDRYRGLIRQLRKTFSAMRDENRLLRRQVNGDEVDIDALVEALADSHDGSEMSSRLFTQRQRTGRNIAVMLMVDMSGSTRGWINQAERESLILLTEALETLGDRYAIYGFSGIARTGGEIYRIKAFDEPCNEQVRGRISAIRPRDYTRMGLAIRHLGGILKRVEARNRVLITLSDGKPDDYDNYRGAYAIEDTRRALQEARRDGIHPYCITIDRQARDYLPRLYGPASYSVVGEVRQLPCKISEIYRRLTAR